MSKDITLEKCENCGHKTYVLARYRYCSDCYVKLTNMRNKLRKKIKEIRNNMTNWKPYRKGQAYFLFNTRGRVMQGVWGSQKSKDRYKFGNVFKTKNEAVKAQERVRKILVRIHQHEN